MELFDVRVDAIDEVRRAFAINFIAECDRSGEPLEVRKQRAERALRSMPGVALSDVARPLARWLEARLKNIGATFALLSKGQRWIAIDPDHPARGDQEMRIVESAPGLLLVEHEREAIARLSARHPELEKQLIEEETEEVRRVYADWLIEKGDPRGELMAIMMSPDRHEQREKELFLTHRRHLLGPLVQWPHFDLRWRFGSIEAVEANLYCAGHPTLEGELLLEAIADLIALPSARFLRGFTCYYGYPSGVVHALAQMSPLRSLRRLTLGPNGWFDQRAGPTTGPMSPLLAKLPLLRDLSLTSLDFDLDVELPELRSLRLIGAMVESTLTAFGALRWPALETLELWFETSTEHWVPAYPPPAAAFFAVMTAEMPRLRHLTIKAAPDPNAVCEILVDAPFVGNLETLDLSESSLDDRGAALLSAHAASFEKLARLDLRKTKVSGELMRLAARFGARLIM